MMSFLNTVSDKVPVAFSVNEPYAKYCGVTIQSIIENSSPANHYYVFIMYTKLSDITKNKLMGMERNNLSIELICVENKIDKSILFVDGHVTEETYFRILIPELLSDWEKVIYLDVDLLCLRDIASLMHLEMSGKLIAAAITIGNENRKEYVRDYLGGVIPYETYFNAGVMIFHNDEINRRFQGKFKEKCYEYLREKKVLKGHDQDLLNVICYPHIYYLDSRWNMTLLRIMKDSNLQNVEEIGKEEMDKSYILHYASNKPWNQSLKTVHLLFFNYAYHTPFLADIMEDYKKISDTKVYYKNLCIQGYVSLKNEMENVLLCIKSRFLTNGKH